jgi:GT2 family glycosyltransferase
LSLQVAASPGVSSLLIVHVDNGNDTPRTLSEAQVAAGVRLLRLEKNRGYGAGIEGALRRIESEGKDWDAAWCLNSDLEIEPDCLARLQRVLTSHPRVGAVGPTVYWGKDRTHV